jgi:hypothetical protein
LWDARFSVPAELGNIVGVQLNNPGEDAKNRVITPGEPEHSELLRRISFRGSGQMPPIATHELDQQAIALASEWVTNSLLNYIPPPTSYATWAGNMFGPVDGDEAGPAADPDQDGLRNFAEFLYGRDPKDPLSNWKVFPELAEGSAFAINFDHLPNRGGEIRLEHANSLNGPWMPVDTGLTNPFFSPDPGAGRLLLETTEGVGGYYRVLILDP